MCASRSYANLCLTSAQRYAIRGVAEAVYSLLPEPCRTVHFVFFPPSTMSNVEHSGPTASGNSPYPPRFQHSVHQIPTPGTENTRPPRYVCGIRYGLILPDFLSAGASCAQFLGRRHSLSAHDIIWYCVADRTILFSNAEWYVHEL